MPEVKWAVLFFSPSFLNGYFVMGSVNGVMIRSRDWILSKTDRSFFSTSSHLLWFIWIRIFRPTSRKVTRSVTTTQGQTTQIACVIVERTHVITWKKATRKRKLLLNKKWATAYCESWHGEIIGKIKKTAIVKSPQNSILPLPYLGGGRISPAIDSLNVAISGNSFNSCRHSVSAFLSSETRSSPWYHDERQNLFWECEKCLDCPVMIYPMVVLL